MSEKSVSSRPGEFSLIERYFAPLATSAGAAHLQDDAAVFAPDPGCELVVTKDMLMAGVHFFKTDPPFEVAQKALGVNLSDLAAKGAEPKGYLLGLGLSKDISEEWVAEFCRGLKLVQDQFQIDLLGGDTISCPDGPLLSITAFGQVPTGKVVRRNTAVAGAHLYVTGTIGDAALGLKLRLDEELSAKSGLSAEQRDFLLKRYLLPEPRVEAAQALRDYAVAAMDVSDGLIADLGHMCATSKVRVQLRLDDVPFSAATSALIMADAAFFEAAITGGDDYEILAAVMPQDAHGFEEALQAAGLQCSRIGELLAPDTSEPAIALSLNGKAYALDGAAGFTHF
ncbi:Thiamine-monophosphate kinase [Pseudovibrio axinellae]|uniref:Thiamine-monophosphate kinase n=1 Tax=Pseudovibrio axinellae TaxID=989403 RepID=A0A165WNZ7_9HYPH|nr:thiamine-phosphate kinase [Pseudovibrio axinellae]KZL16745.1 Thiamine-monophosphate kinase [Pseudovibrio axinellae]SEQ76364.1 thiamine-phosphate kinase [Pseudovibrio axinellae]